MSGYSTVYSWTELSRAQQQAARRIWRAWIAAGGETTVSQVARYLDAFAAWDRGTIDATEVERITGHGLTADR